MRLFSHKNFLLLGLAAGCISSSLLVTTASASLSLQPRADVQRTDPQTALTASRRVIVRFDANASATERAQLRAAVGAVGHSVISDVSGLEILQLGAAHTAKTAEVILDASNDVLYAQADSVRQLMVMPDDEFFVDGLMWGLYNTGQDPGQACVDCSSPEGTPDADIDAPEAWDQLVGCAGCVPPVIAVADSGMREDHEDFSGQMWSNDSEMSGSATVDDDGNGYVDDTHGWDWSNISSGGCHSASGDNNPNAPAYTGADSDASYHGTHVGSTIGARSNNALGIPGVNDQTRLMNIRIGNQQGSILTSNELCGLSYAIANGARVVNGSYGGAGRDYAVGSLIAANPQVLFVFSAGNDGTNNEYAPKYPCSDPAPNIICVAASNNFDNLTPFSNYGKLRVDIAAPGDSIVGAHSATSSAYEYLDGTSMAAPHVSGVASLLLYKYPALTAAQVKDLILRGADPIASMYCKTVTGGRLNAADSLALAAGTLVKPAAVPCAGGGSGTPTPPGGDKTPPIVALIGGSRPRLPASGAFSFHVWCNEQCSFTYEVVLSKRAGKFAGAGAGVAGKAFKTTVRPSKAQKRKLRKALRKGRVRAVINVVAVDVDGNTGKPAQLVSYLSR